MRSFLGLAVAALMVVASGCGDDTAKGMDMTVNGGGGGTGGGGGSGDMSATPDMAEITTCKEAIPCAINCANTESGQTAIFTCIATTCEAHLNQAAKDELNAAFGCVAEICLEPDAGQLVSCLATATSTSGACHQLYVDCNTGMTIDGGE